MQDKRDDLYLRKSAVRFSMALRISIVLLIVLWLIFFVTLRLCGIDFPRRVDIIILSSVMAVCALLFVVDTAFAKRRTRCPYCGCKWSFYKYRPFRRGPLDLLNNTDEYICYRCDTRIDIK